MLRRMRWFTAVAVVISLVGGGLVFAQGTPGSMPDKMMSPPSPPGGTAGKASMPMEKGSMPAEKAGMDKPGMGTDKAGMPAGKAKAATAPVDINMADEAALASLKGIGPKKAKAIVDYRQKNGPFKSVDELVKVPGIGPKTLAGLKDQLTLGKVM